jgi:hypothetical protein
MRHVERRTRENLAQVCDQLKNSRETCQAAKAILVAEIKAVRLELLPDSSATLVKEYRRLEALDRTSLIETELVDQGEAWGCSLPAVEVTTVHPSEYEIALEEGENTWSNIVRTLAETTP